MQKIIRFISKKLVMSCPELKFTLETNNQRRQWFNSLDKQPKNKVNKQQNKDSLVYPSMDNLI